MTPLSNDLRFPTGKFHFDPDITSEKRRASIASIRDTPAALRSAVAGLSETQLDTPYREGGWTVRQVVHHVPDSHMNSYIRFKMALTEDQPTIKPYDETMWAKLIDGRSSPVEPSLSLLEGLHSRLVVLLRSLSASDVTRKFNHPE